MYFDRFEPAETAVVASLLVAGDTFVDVGAHIGWFTTLAASAVGGTGRVYAYEGFKANYDRLRHNVDLNQSANVAAYNVAVLDKARQVHIGRQRGSDSGSVTVAPRDVVQPTLVEGTTLDKSLPTGTPIKLLKIDVEGLEHQVLAGARERLAQTAHVLLEINERALASTGTDADSVLDILRREGFRSLEKVAERGLRRWRRGQGALVNVLASR